MSARTAALAAMSFWAAAAPASAAASVARAVAGGGVQLEVAGCAAVPTRDVRHVLSVEIGDLLLDDSAGRAADADRLIVRCAGNFASVEASGPGEPPVERMVRLDDFPGDTAARALALLGVELLAARSAAVRERILRRQSALAAPPVEVVAPPPPVAPPVRAHREVRLGAAAVCRIFPAHGGPPALGGRLEASASAWRSGILAGDLEVASGSKTVADVGRATALLISAGATVGLAARREGWRAAAGLGGRIGLLRESGASADPTRISSSSFVRPWGGPTVNASLARTIGRLALSLGGEAGWSLSSVDEVAGGVTAIVVRGPWLAVWLGADLRR